MVSALRADRSVACCASSPVRPNARPNWSVERPNTAVVISMPKRQPFCSISAFCCNRPTLAFATSSLARAAASPIRLVCSVPRSLARWIVSSTFGVDFSSWRGLAIFVAPSMSVVSDRTLCGSITGAILAGNVVASGPFLDDAFLMKSDWRAGTVRQAMVGGIAAMNLLGPGQGRVVRMCQSPSIVPGDGLNRDIYLMLEDFRQGPAWRETDEPADLQTVID